jgi:flavin-dependent dehydrogenase
MGVRAHFRLLAGSSAPDCVEVYFGAGFELYVTPLPDSELLVAALADASWYGGSAQEAFPRAIYSLPRLADRLAGAEQITELAGASPLTGRARAGVLPGLVLLGDAAGFADPITGGGMSQALLSSELLAGHLSRRFPPRCEDLERFDRERQRRWRDYGRLTRMVLWLADRPRLGAGVLRLLGTWPGLFSHLIGVSGGERRFLPGLPPPRPPRGWSASW